MLGHDGADFAAHSLRRTKAQAMAQDCTAQELTHIQAALGHKWVTSTQSYISDTRKVGAFVRGVVV